MPSAATFAKARELYLKQEFPKQYQQMKQAGTLKPHLEETGQEADEMWSLLEAQMANDPELPEEYAERVKALERIPEVVRELVNHDLIHVPPAM